MWRTFFEFCNILSCAIPSKKMRDWFRREKLFDYKNKLNAIKNE